MKESIRKWRMEGTTEVSLTKGGKTQDTEAEVKVERMGQKV